MKKCIMKLFMLALIMLGAASLYSPKQAHAAKYEDCMIYTNIYNEGNDEPKATATMRMNKSYTKITITGTIYGNKVRRVKNKTYKISKKCINAFTGGMYGGPKYLNKKLFKRFTDKKRRFSDLPYYYFYIKNGKITLIGF